MKALTARKMEFRKTASFQALLLGACTFVATALLGTGDLSTRDAIKLRAEEDLKASIAQVIPNQLHDNDLLKDTLTLIDAKDHPLIIYRGTMNGEIVAIAFMVQGNGYGGNINSIMAIDPQGVILGVRVVSHAETPGLGDKIEPEKADWILGFNGLTLNNPPEAKWGVKKDGGHFDQFSGATITPRALVKSIKGGLEFFSTSKDEILGASISNSSTPFNDAAANDTETTSSSLNRESD